LRTDDAIFVIITGIAIASASIISVELVISVHEKLLLKIIGDFSPITVYVEACRMDK
jgi:hypothetical protein